MMHAAKSPDLLDTTADGVCLVDVEQRVTYWNLGAERLSGLTRAEVLGSRCPDRALLHVDPLGRSLCRSSCLLQRTIRERRSQELEVLLRDRDGGLTPVRARLAPIADPTGRPLGAMELFSTTLNPERAAERFAPLPGLALYDRATGLPTRRMMELALPARLAQLERTGFPCGVLHIGLDNLTEIRAGQPVEVVARLQELVARVLMSTVRAHDLVGHWDDGEYLAVVSGATADHLLDMAARLRGIIESVETQGPDGAVGVTVCVGVAAAQPFDTADTVVRRAQQRALAGSRFVSV